MAMHPNGWRFLVSLSIGLLGAMTVGASDWPAYRHDVQRSGITDEKLSFPLQPAWQWTSARPPAPAWPSTARELNQMTFDHAFQPVVAGGLVCFGSSADDTLRALDAKTGEERWHFAAGGPIRFAPEIANGKIYMASDDGWVHCLELATGKPVWSFRTAPSDERLLGDGRMISRWPCR
ncbi:MAG: PQQ-binding-like beta-propeller repeat protein, partial [Lentisphaerae bacterium]|nr:PQQ-binding-like beta-propeller repeat protein [Lentisphaerota bacterium]